MSQIAKDFVKEWVSENVVAEAYEADGNSSRSEELATQCRVDAKADGISSQELEDAIDDLVGGGNGLVGYIAAAMEAATDEEATRLAEQDG